MASSLVLSRRKKDFNLQAGRPAKKNATSDVISSQPIASFLPTHEAGHVIHRTDPEAGHVFSELTSIVIPVPALQTRPCCR